MARLLGPASEDRLVFVPGTWLRGAVGATAVVYTDAAATVLADIRTYDGTSTPGSAVTGSALTVDADSMLPQFWFPDSADVVYVRVDGGTITAVNADFDARLDAADTGIAGKVGKGTLAFDVRDYGAVGDDTADDTVAVQAALTAAALVGGVVVLRGRHKVSGMLTVGAGVTLDGYRGSLRQITPLTNTLRVNNASEVTIRGVKVTGVGSDYVNSASVYQTAAIDVRGTSSSVTVEHCTLVNNAGAGVWVGNNVAKVAVRACTITGPGSPPISGPVPVTNPEGDNYGGGVVVYDGTSYVEVSQCDISQYAQGIVTGETARLRIVGNVIHDIVGQHGMYLEPSTDVVVTGNIISGTEVLGLKLQVGSLSWPDIRQVAITGNVITGTGSHCILLTDPVGAAARTKRVTITGNTLEGVGTGAGIYLLDASGVTVVGNSIYNVTAGIKTSGSAGLTIALNRIDLCTEQGVLVDSSSDVQVYQNRIDRTATANGGATEFGMQVSGSSSAVTFDGNVVSDVSGNMRYGIYVSSADQATCVVRNNDVTGAAEFGARVDGAATFKEWSNNSLVGVSGPTTGLPAAQILPSRYSGPRSNGYLGANFDGAFANISVGTWATGVLLVTRIDLSVPGSIAQVRYLVSTAGGSLTAGQNLLGVYDYTGALIGQSADLTAAWGSTGIKTTNLVTPTARQNQGSPVFVALLANGTTSPNIRGVTSSGLGNDNLSGQLLRFATAGSALTALPLSLPTLVADTRQPWLAVL